MSRPVRYVKRAARRPNEMSHAAPLESTGPGSNEPPGAPGRELLVAKGPQRFAQEGQCIEPVLPRAPGSANFKNGQKLQFFAFAFAPLAPASDQRTPKCRK